MIVDLNTYLVNKSFVQEWHKENGQDKPCLTISIMAPATHCPCVVLAFYMAESLGFTPELSGMIRRLIDFYNYTQINNQPDNSPFKELDHGDREKRALQGSD